MQRETHQIYQSSYRVCPARRWVHFVKNIHKLAHQAKRPCTHCRGRGERRELRRTKRRRKSSINWKLWKVCFGPDFGGNRRIKFLKFQPTLYSQKKKAKLHAPKVAAKVLKKLKQSTRNTSACAAVFKVRLKLVFINFKCIFLFRRGKLWQLGEAAHSHRYTL